MTPRRNPRNVPRLVPPKGADFVAMHQAHDQIYEEYMGIAREALVSTRARVLQAKRDGLGERTTYHPEDVRAAGRLLRDAVRHVIAAGFSVAVLTHEYTTSSDNVFENARDRQEAWADALQRWIVSQTKTLLRRDVVEWSHVSKRGPVVTGRDLDAVTTKISRAVKAIDDSRSPARVEGEIAEVRRSLGDIAFAMGYDSHLWGSINGGGTWEHAVRGARAAAAKLRATPRDNPVRRRRAPRRNPATDTGPAAGLLVATIGLVGLWFFASRQPALALPTGTSAP